MNDPLLDDLTLLQQLAGQLNEHGGRLGEALTFADDGARAASGAAALEKILGAMGRYQTYGPPALSFAAPAAEPIAGEVLSSNPDSIEQWTHAFLRRREQKFPQAAPFNADAAAATGWALWKDRLDTFFRGQSVDIGPVGRDELLLAAMDLAPARWFRRRLDQMTVAEWSAAILSVFGLQPERPPSPFWLLIAGLRALGAGQSLLEGVIREAATKPTPTALTPPAPPPPTSPDEVAVATSLALGAAGSRTAGVLVIARDEGSVTRDWRADALGLDRPILVVRRGDYMLYKAALDWLHQAGAFTGLTDESTES